MAGPQHAAATIAAFPAVTRKDGPAGRFYECEGLKLPSVTHVLSCIAKPALINWAAGQERTACVEAATELYLDLAKTPPMTRAMFVATLDGRIGKQKAHRKQLEKAGEIGSQAHALIEWNLRHQLGQSMGPEPRVTEQALYAFTAFQSWAASVTLQPIYIEQTVFSKTYGYAGTMDLLATVDGVSTLVDWKTAKAVYPESFLQNVAYRRALSEMGHTTATAGLIVRLPKTQTDPPFEAVPVPEDATLFPTFLATIELWKWTFANDEAYRARRAAR